MRGRSMSTLFQGRSRENVASPKAAVAGTSPRNATSPNSAAKREAQAVAMVLDLVQLQHKGRSSFKLRSKAQVEALKHFTVAPVREIYADAAPPGAPRERRGRAPEDNLAEQRHVTSVFVMVRGLDDALERGDLERVQECFATINLCVKDRGGMLRQFIVDDKGVVAIAFFGVRGHSFEDNEWRAVRFTLSVVRALRRWGLQCNCGVTVGEGFCGLVGAPRRCEYAVMGPSVNLSARLMAAAAKAGEHPVYVDERVERRTRETSQQRLCGFHPLEPIQAKGFAAPVKVFGLTEMVEARAPSADRRGRGGAFEIAARSLSAVYGDGSLGRRAARAVVDPVRNVLRPRPEARPAARLDRTSTTPRRLVSA